MAQATQIILQKNNIDLVNQVLNSNQPIKITAEEDMQITLVDAKTGQPAKKLQAKKVADDLLIADENDEALLTIEDYYLTDNVALGTVSDVGFVEFDYLSAETGATTQVASETSYTTLVSEMLGDASLIGGISNGALLGSIGAAALGVAAISSSSSDSSSKPPANELPVSKDSIITATEDTVATGQLEAATDVDGDDLTYALKDNAANGTVTVNADGSYSYTPNADFNGEDSFTYTIDDGQGGVITQTATITIAAVNDAPVSEDSVIAATEDTVAEGQLATTTDVDGDTLTYALDEETTNGSVIVNADGSYSYTPNANFHGEDSFTYTVTDGTETITKTATITVASVNDLPVSTDTAIEATEDTVATGQLEAATDADGDDLTYALKDNAANGKVTVNADGSYSYAPNADFNGEDSFTYTVTDGQGGVITQTATITIAAVNDAPVSEDSVIGVAENIIDTGMLAEATDVDSDTLTYALDEETTNGSVIVNADGSYTYTPNADFNGEDSFTYTIDDGQGGVITQTATITVDSLTQESNIELQEVFETSVVSEQQTVVEKQASSYINEVIEFEVTGQNGMPQLELTNGSNIIRGSYNYTFQGPGMSSSSSGSISSVGSNNSLIELSKNTLSPGKYTLDLYVYSSGSLIDFNVTEFKDVEYTEFTGYQDITGNIFADDNVNVPNNYDIQIAGQTITIQAGSPSAESLTVNTENGQLTVKPNGDYTYQSDRTELGLDESELAEDFYIKVIDLDTKQASHYGINITSDATSPEPSELTLHNFESDGISQDDSYSISEDSISLSSVDDETALYSNENTIPAFNDIGSLTDSKLTELPSIVDLLDVNNDELVFEGADKVDANIANETATTSVSSGASEPSTAVDFTIVQALNDNMQTEATFHIM
ncbi:tandem-95 repeat protein [Psychrobacter sp. AOP7-A1-24]|uniref:tandem-95 repeat protein n=1 Tax=Psychrobacter sp. AOP7-A1-24 TaxID=3457646 RepID=UPI00402B3AFB